MNTTRTTLASILAAASLLTLGACSSDDKNVSAPAPSTSSAQPTKNVTPGVESPNASQSASTEASTSPTATLPVGPIKLSTIDWKTTPAACDRLVGKPSDFRNKLGLPEYKLNDYANRADSWRDFGDTENAETAGSSRVTNESSSHLGLGCQTFYLNESKKWGEYLNLNIHDVDPQRGNAFISSNILAKKTIGSHVIEVGIKTNDQSTDGSYRPISAETKAAATKLVDQVAKQIAD